MDLSSEKMAAHEARKRPFDPAEEQAEVAAGGGEHGVDALAVATVEATAVDAVLGLEMADHRLDGGVAMEILQPNS